MEGVAQKSERKGARNSVMSEGVALEDAREGSDNQAWRNRGRKRRRREGA